MKKEIERRWVLRDLPIKPFATNSYGNIPDIEVQNISQYYYLVDGVWKRIRKIDSNIFGTMYLHTVKTYKDGITYEEESDYSYEEFISLMKEINSDKYQCTMISKTRYIFNTGVDADFDNERKNIKWEVDVFNFNLIIAEIEIPDINYIIDIPDYIKEKMIYEVTGISEFSNRSLSEPALTHRHLK